MEGWTATNKEIGRRNSEEILTALVALRASGDSVDLGEADASNCRSLIETAARVEPIGTVAALAALAESLLHRLAEQSDRPERETLQALLSETEMASAPPKPSGRRRRA